MEFEEFLKKKPELGSGQQKLKIISVKQYANRLANMRADGIYNGEQHIDSSLEKKLQLRYKDWKTYRRTIQYYLDSMKY